MEFREVLFYGRDQFEVIGEGPVRVEAADDMNFA